MGVTAVCVIAALAGSVAGFLIAILLSVDTFNGKDEEIAALREQLAEANSEASKLRAAVRRT